jgi:hypothetical protein
VYDKDYIYFIDGRWTRLAYFFAIPSKYEAPQTIEFFFREVSRLHGFLEYVKIVRDNTFSSIFWQGLCRLEGGELTPSTLFPLVGCETWHIRFQVVISVTQLESTGMRHNGLLVWMWVPRTHMIDLFHFWDTLRGNGGAHAIW